MKHTKSHIGTKPINFQDDYTYELIHNAVPDQALHIAITKGLDNCGGNLAIGDIFPGTRKLYLHNPRKGHTISKENLETLYNLADSLKDYDGDIEDIDVPFEQLEDGSEEDYSTDSPTGIANPADYMSIVQEDTDNDGDIDKVSVEEKNEED